jgi:ketosteroid isomerase-like protein
MTRLVAVIALVLGLQPQPAPLQQMVDTERAFAARAMVAGWKQAFLEFFADDAVGFDGTARTAAKAQVRQAPDPAAGVQLLWEPRYGDIAESGELGWLTGPSTSINPARNSGAPRPGNYASVWKRQPDGSFKVLIDVGIAPPEVVSFAPGFTRAPRAGRFTGSPADATATLRTADQALSSGITTGPRAAYQGRLAPGARMHRNGLMPLTGVAAILAFLASQPAAMPVEHGFAETARSGDLGYTWGRYGEGAYVRVWTRGADGRWRVALDVVQ